MGAKLKVLDLFSGIGGFSLGLERTGGFETVAFCEIDPFCRKVLAKHWPGVRQYEDVRSLTADTLSRDGIAVDVICGGFPCQDISHAGLGAGLHGVRSGLWSQYARLIGEIRPRFVVVENVSALLSNGMGRVIGDLAEIGYNAEWDCIPAGYIGAPHLRERIYILAYPDESDGQTGMGLEPYWPRPLFAGCDLPGFPIWLQAAADFIGMDDGVSHRAYGDRVGALGNAVVPQIPELIGNAILASQVSA